jgi:hypothetical protein
MRQHARNQQHRIGKSLATVHYAMTGRHDIDANKTASKALQEPDRQCIVITCWRRHADMRHEVIGCLASRHNACRVSNIFDCTLAYRGKCARLIERELDARRTCIQNE